MNFEIGFLGGVGGDGRGLVMEGRDSWTISPHYVIPSVAEESRRPPLTPLETVEIPRLRSE